MMNRRKHKPEIGINDLLLWDKQQAAAMLSMGPTQFDACRKERNHPISELEQINGRPVRFDPDEVRKAAEKIKERGEL